MKIIMTISYLLALILVAGSAYSADFLEFRAKLTGDQEVPPVVNQIRARALFEVNPDRTMMDFELKAINNGAPVGLLGQAGAHIHCGAVGQNGPIVAFLSGVITGGVDGMFKIKATLTDANIVKNTCMDTIQQSITTLKELVDAMLAGKTYTNIHSNAHPAGETRGQIVEDIILR
ncbi:CHRD domain-containing protein [Nitrosomonas sp. Nm33]|nr:CHRD domain-containing protein [Nitrosomonas sp. Nm33]